MLIPNPWGNFHFTKGSPFYASAVLADPGFEIVHAIFEKPVPLNAGFDAIQRELQSCGRPVQALCGMELRGAAPYPNRPSFMEFNSNYVDRLKSLDLLVDGLVPMTRANLAVKDRSVSEQCVYAFLYTVPSKANRMTFATSAIADLKRHADGSVQNVASDDVSPAGLREKVSFVIHVVDEKLKEIGGSWDLATQIRIYTVHPMDSLIPEIILPVIGAGAHHGITWHYVYPPVVGLELEIDVRGVLRESVISETNSGT
jgi:hypothetical protein